MHELSREVLAAFIPSNRVYAMLQVRSEGSPMLKIIMLLKLARKNTALAWGTVVRPMIWS